MDKEVDVAIIGAGTAGLVALSKVRKKTDRFVLINGGDLGTTCARVGCMPSKAVIQVAEDFHRRTIFDRSGIEGQDSIAIDVPEAMEYVQDLRDTFVDRVLAGSTDEMGEEFIEGYAEFVEPNVLRVNNQTVRAKKIIIATGSQPFVPEAWRKLGDRVLTTDSLFEQSSLPRSMAVIGLGVIGLEMGQSLHRMGIDVTGVDQLNVIGGLEDPVVNETAISILGKELPMWLGQSAQLTDADGKVRVRSGDHEVIVDKVLVSIGRRPNVRGLQLDRIGVELDERGVPIFNPNTMQIGDLPIFIAGDVTGFKAILHEAGDEGRIAGYNAVHDPVVEFKRKTPLAITFCDPNIATVGTPWSELNENTIAIGEMRFGPLGRALIMGKNKGILRVYADKGSGKVLGASMIAPKGENLAHQIAWAIEQQLTVLDLLRMPFYHPVIEEALQSALYSLLKQIEVPAGDMPEFSRLGIKG